MVLEHLDMQRGMDRAMGPYQGRKDMDRQTRSAPSSQDTSWAYVGLCWGQGYACVCALAELCWGDVCVWGTWVLGPGTLLLLQLRLHRPLYARGQ